MTQKSVTLAVLTPDTHIPTESELEEAEDTEETETEGDVSEEPEPEEPELVMLPHYVDIVVEDGVTKVFCTSTGRRIAGWDSVKTDLGKGKVKLTLEADFNSITTIKTPPPPPAKDKQLDMFPKEPEPVAEAANEEPKEEEVKPVATTNPRVSYKSNGRLVVQ